MGNAVCFAVANIARQITADDNSIIFLIKT